jgi:hypothetical protein
MRLADGMDFSSSAKIYNAIVRMQLGLEPAIPISTPRGMMEYHIYAPHTGILTDVAGLESARHFPGIVMLESYSDQRLGSIVTPPEDFRGQKLATVLARGDSTVLAKANCLSAVSQILFNISHSQDTNFSSAESPRS